MSKGHYTLDNNGRRKWDKDVYENEYYDGKWMLGEEKKETITREEEIEQLKQTKESTVVVNGNGLYCKVCNKQFKDSQSYTNHINSQEHNSKAGIKTSYHVADIRDVKNRLALLKQKKMEKEMTPEEEQKRKEEWKKSRKQRKKEWKERQQQHNSERSPTRENEDF